jgi:aspartyl-tRNA(Asn)/glutamyl-tRNA(Gln) amidotransferase subunit A
MIPDPVAALEACISAIRARNPELNALVWADETGAQRAAESSAERRARKLVLSDIDGLPIVVKANVAVKGAPWTAALTPFRDRIAEDDSTVVAQLRRAGAVIVGIANMHEAALGATTTSPLYGQAKHPLNPALTPGGSSGGSASAVAAGMALGAIGTDTMGSVRLPSAYCGIAGIKPSFGRVSRRGVELLSWSLDHVGLHAAKVAILRDMLAATAFDRDDPYAEAFSGSLTGGIPLEGLRIAVARTPGVVFQDGIAARVDAAKGVFQTAGAKLTEIVLDGDLARERRRGLLICEAEFASLRGDGLEAFLAETSPTFRHLLSWGAKQPAAKLAAATAVFGEARLAARKLFSAADIVIMPATPHTAFPYTEQAPETQADLTVFANIAGLPAATVPMGVATNGLPVGLQILGPRGADGLVLSVAESFERATM